MKQCILLLLLTFFSVTTVSAQGWLGDDGGADMQRSQWGIDLGVGKMANTDGSVGFAGGIRYQYNIHRFVGLDLIGINYVGQTMKGEGMGPSILQTMMGVRGKTPTFYQDVAGYLGVRMGYGRDFYLKEGGLALEVNIGMYVTRNLILGYFFNMQNLNLGDTTGKYKFNGLRVGLVF